MKIKVSEKITYIQIKKKNGQAFLNQVNSLFKNKILIDQKKKVLHVEDYILFPLIEDNELIEKLLHFISESIDYKIISKEPVLTLNYKYKSLEEALKKKIPSEFYELIPKSYDIIGDIAILEFDKFETPIDKLINLYKTKIAKAVIKVNKNVKSVYEKKSEIKDMFRLRKFTHLYGEGNSETIHKENNCSFKLDIFKSFFTPRLVFERNRITTCNILENELIIDMFAGVGPFSIQIAKKHNVVIHAFDINPNAYNYLKTNIKFNKIKGTIFPYNFDIKVLLQHSNEVGSILKNQADRIIMNLPEKSLNYINIACFLMKESGGILHNYQFCEKPDSVNNAITNLKEELDNFNWSIEKILASKIVKPFSPKADLVVVDLKIKYKDLI